ncbi:hypothetical protein RHSIM_Rhsim10G0040300 [Rhododendron simsii]|uniref:Uncharacterized protein n=1 Tax=Rhododendron simsii TaxID=118357 RepID=A0A834GFV2_RHOSS|nr:hypothetical protein RHSIM_Rhsim10G0040300 [Rhododendron simsii]
MTVKQLVMDDDAKKDKRRRKVFYYEEKSGETDQESVGSSEEAESPRSVARIRRWAAKKIAHVHSQILRIREEDSHIGEDLGEGCPHMVDVVIFSKPILPASPLSGRGVH